MSPRFGRTLSQLWKSLRHAAPGMCPATTDPPSPCLPDDSRIFHGLVSGWRVVAYSLLPLLLIFYEVCQPASPYHSNFLAAILFICLLVSLFGVLYFCQDCLLYYTDTPENSRVYIATPPDYVSYDIVSVLTDDLVTLKGFLIWAPKPSAGERAAAVPTVLYLHGNAGNVGHRLRNALEMTQLLRCNVLLLDYRGYGHSEGSPSEQGLYRDAVAGIRFLLSHEKVDPTRIVLFGRSLGGAVAIHVAAQPSIAQHVWMLMVENSFTHIADVAEIMFHVPGFNYLPRLFYKNKFASLTKMGAVRIPTLLISGLADQLVPPAMMAALFQRCPAARKRLLKVRGGTHNETWSTQGYYEMLLKFMTEQDNQSQNNAQDARLEAVAEETSVETTGNGSTSMKPPDYPVV